MADWEAAKPYRGLNPDELQNLRQIAQEQWFTAGQRIFGEGDPGDGVYVTRDARWKSRISQI